MEKTILFFLVVMMTNVGRSQDLSIKDPATGKYFGAERYADYKGSPYLVDEWITGDVTTGKGVYKNIQLKVNAVSNSIILNKAGEELEIVDDIKEFTLMPIAGDTSTYRHFVKGISGGGIAPKQFVERLVAGRTTLYKSNQKTINEVNEINVGIVKTFRNIDKYYLSDASGLKPIELDKKQVISLLADKNSQIGDFISKEKLSFKNEKDLVKVIRYYNTL